MKYSYLIQCLVLLLFMTIFFALNSPYFFSFSNFINILNSSVIIGLMAIGATFVIASGAIDLSAASTMALSSVICALCAQNYHLNNYLLLLISLLVGSTCGLTIGSLINVTKAPSFIITLGMLSVIRAISFIITGGLSIYGLAENITKLASEQFFGFSFFSIIFLSGIIVSHILLNKTRFGTHVLLMGDNSSASEYMGIKVDSVRLLIFILAGSFSGLAGFIFMLRTNSGDPSGGLGYELNAITAVVLGGANLYGGRASIATTFFGVLCLGVLQNGLNLLAISTFYQNLFIGLVLVLASFLQRIGPR